MVLFGCETSGYVAQFLLAVHSNSSFVLAQNALTDGAVALLGYIVLSPSRDKRRAPTRREQR
jgi:hypothetical protein